MRGTDTIDVFPLPSGDYEARRGPLVARGHTATEAETALLELSQLRWEDIHVLDKPPIDEDQVEGPVDAEDR